MDPLTTALAAFAARAVSRAGGQQLADRIANLVGLQRAEIKLLESLGSDIDHLLAGPFRTAERQIQDAGKPWRTEQGAQALLLQARTSLTQALGQDKDPLRLSLAALLLAGVWNALDSPEDCPERLLEAHSHAVEAAKRVADRDPRPPSRVRKWVRRHAKRTRPRSVRLATTLEIGSPDLSIPVVSTYFATRPARRQEAELERLHDYVGWLRVVLVEMDSGNDSLPRYRPVLQQSYRGQLGDGNVMWMHTWAYALKYIDVASDINLEESAEGKVLSKDRARMKVLFKPVAFWKRVIQGDGDSRRATP